MKINQYTSAIALLLSAGAFIFAGIIGNKAYKEISVIKKTSAGKQIMVLQEKISMFEGQLTALSNSLASLDQRSVERPSTRAAAGTGDISAHMSDILVAMNDSMFQLEQIVDASGMKTIATNDAVDQSIMKQVYDEYYERKLIATHRERMEEMNQALHTADTETYDEELKDLYEEARFVWGRKDNPEQREVAMKELLEKYPDANATGMIIAESAMMSALKNNLEDAERYYGMLAENDNFSDIVTDWNLKAVPTMQYYLAGQYIDKGRPDDARRMINALTRNNETMIFVGGGGSKYQTTQNAINGLRERIESK